MYKSDGTRGHHMGDYIPEQELAKFLAKTGNASAQEQAKALEAANRSDLGSLHVAKRFLASAGHTHLWGRVSYLLWCASTVYCSALLLVLLAVAFCVWQSCFHCCRR